MTRYLLIIEAHNKNTKGWSEDVQKLCQNPYYLKLMTTDSKKQALKNLVVFDEYMKFYVFGKYYTDYCIIEDMVCDADKQAQPLIKKFYTLLETIDIDINQETENDEDKAYDENGDINGYTQLRLLNELDHEKLTYVFNQSELDILHKYYKELHEYAPLIGRLWGREFYELKEGDLSDKQLDRLVELLLVDNLIVLQEFDEINDRQIV